MKARRIHFSPSHPSTIVPASLVVQYPDVPWRENAGSPEFEGEYSGLQGFSNPSKNDLLSYGIEDNFSGIVQIQFLHQVGPMGFYGVHTYI